MFEEEAKKPFRKSRGRKEERDRAVFVSQEDNEDKSGAPASFEPALDPETKTSQVVIGEESKPVIIEKPEPAVSTAKVRVEKGERTAVDKQIASMKRMLKKFEVSSKQFDKIATSEQKENRAKEIEALKRGIEDAERKKVEFKTEKNKWAEQAQARRNKDSVKVNPLKQVLEDKINKIQTDGSTNEESIDQYAKTLVKGVFGDDVFDREDAVSAVVPTLADIPVEQVQITQEEKNKKEKKGTGKKRGETTKKEKPKSNNGGPAPASGFTPDEEAEQRLRAQRRAARAKEEKTVKPQEVKAPEVVAGGEKKSEVEKPKTEQLDLSLETSPVEKWGVSEEEAKRKSNGEQKKEQKKENKEKTIEEEIVEARKKVDETRMDYVKEDYENTNRWTKIKNFFRHIKQEKSPDAEYYQAQYQNALIDLRNVELAKVKNSGLQGKELNETLAGTLRYFKYDELVNVVNERTQARAEHQGWPGKVMGMMEGIGRSYNKLSFKQKLLTAGAMWGLAGATGGASLLARRIFTGAGMAVALEAMAEKISNKRQSKKADQEAHEQVDLWDELHSLHQADDPMLSINGISKEEFYLHREKTLERIFDQDIFWIDNKLQKQKRDALFRKAAAFGVGFGSGYLYKEIFHALGVDDLFKGTKESLVGSGINGSETAEQIQERLNETSPATSNTALPKTGEVPSVSQEAADVKTDLIKDFVNQDIVVEKGDSVWKISGRLADNLGLDGSERTHFVDALKDKFGDVQLQAGEHINFSEHGINEDFVKHAFEDSNAISPEQSAQILENNTRLEAFAEANPNVRLTDEITKNILEGKTGIAAEQASNEFRFGQQVDLEHQPVPEGASPEDIASEYGARADGWYDQIFKVENVQVGDRILGRDVVESLKIRDVFHDAQLFQQGASGGYTTGLSRQEIANFAKFDMNVSNGKSILFDRAGFFRNNPNATVLDYLKKVASLTRRGQKIGSFTAL